MNNAIKEVCQSQNVYFFNQNQIALFQPFNNPITQKKEIKIDNHPTMDEQYTVLYYYFNYLINLLKIEEQKSRKKIKESNS